MITKRTDREMIDYLLAAEQEVREVHKLTDQNPELTIKEAYELQKKLIDRKIADGARRIGVKLGLTSKAKQQMMGINEAIYGYLLDNMLSVEWEPVDYRRFIHPKAEPEIAFLMGEDLQGQDVTADDVLRATKYVAPAIEIIDSRYKDFKFTLVDVVADNCSSAQFIVGSKWVSPDSIDLAEIGMVMSKNGEVATVGAGAAVLGNPAQAVAWAVNKLGERGEGLKKGDIVLSGALSEAVAFEAGDSCLAQFDGLGSVSFFCK
ncbi:fumarylacetoacetate hydrolase family protein [Fictibacillus sp. Mic-4]|uniref:2-keto-4-pentenoate hydratase n=1 Tax=Fictibacillus sp. Mic-4 TaxID=3132826 RepID=UPI003CF5EED8